MHVVMVDYIVFCYTYIFYYVFSYDYVFGLTDLIISDSRLVFILNILEYNYYFIHL